MKIAALLSHVEIFGGVRRYIEIGNALCRRSHEFVLFQPEGTPPEWLTFTWGALAERLEDIFNGTLLY